PCYGCVASYLQRTVAEAPPAPPPDYSDPGGAVAGTTVPAPKASIAVIAALHAVVTLDLLAQETVAGVRGQESGDRSEETGSNETAVSSLTPDSCPLTPATVSCLLTPDFTSLLFTLRRVPGVFDEA